MPLQGLDSNALSGLPRPKLKVSLFGKADGDL